MEYLQSRIMILAAAMQNNRQNTDSNTRIKVCFVSLDAYPLFNPKASGVQGGAEVDVFMLATELAKDKGYNVSVIAGDFGQAPLERISDVTIYRTADIATKPFSAVVSLWKAMRTADADVYFKKGASFVTCLVVLFGWLKRRLFFYRSATTAQWWGTFLDRYHFVQTTAFKWILRRAAVVFVQNKSDIERMKKTAGVEAVFVPNGHRLQPVTDCARDTILWVGRSAAEKGPNAFIELARQFPEERFVMICQQASDDADYAGIVSGAKAAKNIEFIERVPFSQMESFYQRAKVLVNTSDFEGFPNVFIEAGKYGVAILSLNVNPDGFLDEYNCGLCAGGDWDKFVESLNRLLDGRRYVEMGANARKYVEANHDITKIIERYKQCFCQAIKKAGDKQ